MHPPPPPSYKAAGQQIKAEHHSCGKQAYPPELLCEVPDQS